MVIRINKNPLASQLGYAFGNAIYNADQQRRQKQQQQSNIENLLGYARMLQGQQQNARYQQGEDVREIQSNPQGIPSQPMSTGDYLTGLLGYAKQTGSDPNMLMQIGNMYRQDTQNRINQQQQTAATERSRQAMQQGLTSLQNASTPQDALSAIANLKSMGVDVTKLAQYYMPKGEEQMTPYQRAQLDLAQKKFARGEQMTPYQRQQSDIAKQRLDMERERSKTQTPKYTIKNLKGPDGSTHSYYIPIGSVNDRSQWIDLGVSGSNDFVSALLTSLGVDTGQGGDTGTPAKSKAKNKAVANVRENSQTEPSQQGETLTNDEYQFMIENDKPETMSEEEYRKSLEDDGYILP